MRPVSSGTEAEPTEGGVLVNVGPDFFEADRAKSNGVDSNGNGEGIEKKETSPTSPAPNTTATSPKPEPNGTPPPATDTLMPPPDVDMDEGSPYDPLFDDDMGGDADAEGESVIPSTGNTALPTPMAGSPPPSATPGLALPTASGLDSTSVLPSNGFDTPPTTSQVSGDVTSSKTQGQSPPGPTPLFAQTPAQAQAHPSREGAARGIPLLTRTSYAAFSSDIMMTSTMDGQVTLMDRRMPEGGRVGRLQGGEKAPPWCMSACWSGDGNQVLAGRRNGTLDIWDVRRTSNSRAPNLLRTLKTPTESGSISCVVAFPDGRHIAT
jgi:transcriptional activator SPT8